MRVITRCLAAYLAVCAVMLSAADARADLRLLMAGQAHDVTTAETLSATLEVTLSETGDNLIQGRLAGEALTIAIHATGEPRHPCRRGRVCMLFFGRATVSDRDAAIVVALDVDPHGRTATGVYHLTQPMATGGQHHRMGALTVQSGDE